MEALKALPKAAQDLFESVAHSQQAKGQSEASSLKVAWEIVKSRFVPSGDVWVARTDAFVDTEYFTFEAAPAESFITRTDAGQELHNYILSDVLPDDRGTKPTEELLGEWASYINEFQPEADTDHEIMLKAREMFNSDPEKVKSMVRSKKGIAKAVRAVMKNGQLIVSLAFDQRYTNHISKIKGLSVEAAVVRDKLTNTFKKGDLLGFTLAMNSRPINSRAIHV
jgi:hypothetical protein